ncbi:MAG TPA: VOC family protein [Opitutaceae bacterium]
MINRRIILLLGALATMAGYADAKEVKRPKVLGLSHVAFFVDDLDKAVSFYTDFFGYATPYFIPTADDGKLIWIKINDRQSVELFSAPKDFKSSSDRLNHIALETDDCDAMRLYLMSKGFEVPEKTPVGKIGNKNFTISDPDGNRVEIVEYMKDGWTVREKGKFMPGKRISPRMRHVGIKVGQLEPAMKFYGDVFGLKEIYRQSADGKTLSWVNMQVPDGDDYIEFMLFDEPPAIEALHTMHHICLEVDDILDTHRELSTRSLPAGCKHPTGMKLGKNGKWQINYFDPDGSRVEVMEADTFNGEGIPESNAPPPKGKVAAVR